MKVFNRIIRIWKSNIGCACILVLLAIVVCAFRLAPLSSAREDVVLEMEQAIPHWDEKSIFYYHDVPLEKGVYRIIVDYQVASDHQIKIGPKYSSKKIFSTPVLLPQIKLQESFLINVAENGTLAEIEVFEDAPSEHFTQADIRITASYNPFRTMSCYAVYTIGFFFLIFAIVLLDRHCRKKEEQGYRFVLCSLIILAVFVCAPCFLDYVKDQSDTGFHMMRIAYLADDLFGGNFQYRMQSVWHNGYGYPVSVFYGELLMLPAALLYALSVPLWQCYQFYILYTSACTVAASYYVFRKISGDRLAGVFCSVMYVASEWHLRKAYISATIGEFSAFIFIPFIILGFYELLEDEKKRITIIHFTIGFSGVIQTHVLTTVMCVILSVIFCVLMVDEVFKKGRWKTLLEAAVWTALVNLFFIVPFLDYYIRYDLVVEHVNLFMFTRNLFELFMPDHFRGLGMAALLSLLFALFLLFRKHEAEGNRKRWTLFALTIICIGMASVYFPWTWISVHLPAIYALCASKMQHAFRYLTPATALISGLLAVVLHKKKTEKIHGGGQETALWIAMAVIMAVCVMQDSKLMKAVMIDGEFDAVADSGQAEQTDPRESDTITAVDAMGVDALGVGDFLYLTTDMDFSFPYSGELQTVFSTGDISISGIERKGTTYTLAVENQTDEDAFLDFPLWNYYGYRARGDRSTFPITDGENKNVRVTLPAGYTGNLKVAFQTPWYWRVADVISIVTIVYLFYAGLLAGNKDRNDT